jgi:hypothetical protein
MVIIIILICNIVRHIIARNNIKREPAAFERIVMDSYVHYYGTRCKLALAEYNGKHCRIHRAGNITT